ncbi:MAG: hypothetical protein FWD71_13830 [Oscillospiraceae bacterium]|nr:hypothetical protein [Oscillospiraceae bacterium]
MFEKIKKANLDFFTDIFGEPIKIDENLNVKYFNAERAKNREDYKNFFIGFLQHFDDKSACICVAPDLLDFAVDFVKRFTDALSSDTAIKYLREYLGENKIKGTNMTLFNSSKICYGLDEANKNKLNLSKKQDTSRFLDKKDFETYDFDFRNMLGWEYYPNFSYSTIIDNKIISCASSSHTNISDNVIEISVITNENYRNKGYSVSNVVTLAEYVLNMNLYKEVRYITDFDNTASRKAAVSAGLMEVGTEIFFAGK